MIRASTSKMIDFSKARLFDRSWWTKVNWVLQEIEVKDCEKLLDLKFVQNASALNYLAGKQAFDHHWKALNSLYNKWLSIVFPWVKGQSDEQQIEKLFDAWKTMYGEPTDKDVNARIEQATKDLYAQLLPKPNVISDGDKCTRTSKRKLRKIREHSKR
jgi:hypothetical protein